jgi:hypothetical protein
MEENNKKKGLLSKLGYPSRERRDDYLTEKMNQLIEMGIPEEIAAGAAATASAADDMFVRDIDENPEVALAMALPGAKLGKALKVGSRWGKEGEAVVSEADKVAKVIADGKQIVAEAKAQQLDATI